MTSRKILFTVLSVALLPATAGAQPPPPPPPPSPPPVSSAPSPLTGTPNSFDKAPMLLGADAELAVPLGKLSDGANPGLGALLRFEYTLLPKLNLTARLGYIHFFGKDTGVGSASYRTIPILAGAKYDLTDTIYAAAELGLFNNGWSVDVDFGPAAGGKRTISDHETDLGLTIGAGMRFGEIDGRAGLQILDLGEAGNTMALGLSVGYNFWHK
jgi:hypothetical protein